jgi:hypothetical protein
MSRQKVLLTVITYPLPSRSYDELVCTAGVLEDGSWIRIYPVPLSFLIGLKRSGKIESMKYTWIELELNKRADDFRPESHSPKYYDFRDITIHEPRLNTDSNWLIRKEYENIAEQMALQKVKEKYYKDFAANKDLYLFVGTTKEWHTRRSLNPFVIIGVFYPMKEVQGCLF